MRNGISRQSPDLRHELSDHEQKVLSQRINVLAERLLILKECGYQSGPKAQTANANRTIKLSSKDRGLNQ